MQTNYKKSPSPKEGFSFSAIADKNPARRRKIRELRQPDRAPTDEELRDAALQFVRKVSGYRVLSRAHQATNKLATAGAILLHRSVPCEWRT